MQACRILLEKEEQPSGLQTRLLQMEWGVRRWWLLSFHSDIKRVLTEPEDCLSNVLNGGRNEM